MRLIDKDALLEKSPTWISGSMFVAGWRIEDEPEIDAVPVVRCRDCKHGKTWKNAWGIEGFKCDLLCVDLSPEAFCSYGARKDGASDEP